MKIYNPIAVPTDLNMLRRKDDPLANYDPSTISIDGGESAERDWATVDADGNIVVQTERNTLSSTRLGTGTYKVTRDTAFPTINGFPGTAPIVCPLSTETESPTIDTLNRQWFTTQLPETEGSHVLYDPVKDLVWATDIDHAASSSGQPDRIAIGNMFAEAPEVYLYLPAAFPRLFLQEADTLNIDLTYRLAFVQATALAGTRTTLIYDMDSYELLEDSNATTGGTQRVVAGHTDDALFIFGDTVIMVYSRDDDGLFDTLLDSESANTAEEAIGFKWGLESNDGHLWYKNGVSPPEWAEFDVAGGSANVSSHDAGFRGIADRLYDYNPIDNCIYYLTSSSSDFHLMKILCASPYTVTQITSTAYSETYDVNTADETIVGCVTMRFTPDYSRIVVLRGGGSPFPYFYLIDPSSGAIEVAFALPGGLSRNYSVETIVSLAGVVVSIGSYNLQIISYTAGSAGTAQDDDPVLIKSRMTSSTEAIVETYRAFDQNKIKTDCGFHIEFARD